MAIQKNKGNAVDQNSVEMIRQYDFSSDLNVWFIRLKQACSQGNPSVLGALLEHKHEVPDVMQSMLYNVCLEHLLDSQTRLSLSSLVNFVNSSDAIDDELNDACLEVARYRELFDVLLEHGVRPGHYQDPPPTSPLLRLLLSSRQEKYELLDGEENIKEWAQWLVNCGADVDLAHKTMQTHPSPWSWLNEFIQEAYILKEKAILEDHVGQGVETLTVSPSRRL